MSPCLWLVISTGHFQDRVWTHPLPAVGEGGEGGGQLQRRDFAAAEQALNQKLEIAKRTNNPQALADVDYEFGLLRFDEEKYPAALEASRDSRHNARRMRADFRLSVLVPVFNEAGTIRTLLERVMAVPIPKEIIVVDDGSTDGTRDVLAAIKAEAGDSPANHLVVVLQPRNQGKGAAVRVAVRHVTGDVVIIQDPADHMYAALSVEYKSCGC